MIGEKSAKGRIIIYQSCEARTLRSLNQLTGCIAGGPQARSDGLHDTALLRDAPHTDPTTHSRFREYIGWPMHSNVGVVGPP